MKSTAIKSIAFLHVLPVSCQPCPSDLSGTSDFAEFCVGDSTLSSAVKIGNTKALCQNTLPT